MFQWKVIDQLGDGAVEAEFDGTGMPLHQGVGTSSKAQISAARRTAGIRHGSVNSSKKKPQSLQVEMRVRELKSTVADQEKQLKEKQDEIDKLMAMLEFGGE